MDEHEAIRRLQRGDLDGLEALVRLHQQRAVRAAYLIVRDAALAEDVAQAAFLRAHSRIGQFDAARPFAPWFYRIVVNLARRAAARAARQTSLASPASGGYPAEAEPPFFPEISMANGEEDNDGQTANETHPGRAGRGRPAAGSGPLARGPGARGTRPFGGALSSTPALGLGRFGAGRA